VDSGGGSIVNRPITLSWGTLLVSDDAGVSVFLVEAILFHLLTTLFGKVNVGCSLALNLSRKSAGFSLALAEGRIVTIKLCSVQLLSICRLNVKLALVNFKLIPAKLCRVVLETSHQMRVL
jgi:hypothetical protein